MLSTKGKEIIGDGGEAEKVGEEILDAVEEAAAEQEPNNTEATDEREATTRAEMDAEAKDLGKGGITGEAIAGMIDTAKGETNHRSPAGSR